MKSKDYSLMIEHRYRLYKNPETIPGDEGFIERLVDQEDTGDEDGEEKDCCEIFERFQRRREEE